MQTQTTTHELRRHPGLASIHLPTKSYQLFSHLEGKIIGIYGWAHVATVGHWKGYQATTEDDGEEFELTRQVFDEMVANFATFKTRPPIYYDHEPGRAAGRIVELERRGDDLWARFEYTEKAAQMVRDGEYFGVSIGFTLQHIDRESAKPVGARVKEVSLTNEPFIDGLTPLQLSVAKRGLRPMTTAKQSDKTKRLSAVEVLEQAKDKVGADTTAEQLVEIVNGLAYAEEAAGDMPAGDPPAVDASADDEDPKKDKDLTDASPDDEEIKAEADPEVVEDVAGSDVIAMLTDATGMDAAAVAAAVRENLDKVAAALSGASGDGTPADGAMSAKALSAAKTDGDKSKALEAKVEKLTSQLTMLSESIKTLKLSGRQGGEQLQTLSEVDRAKQLLGADGDIDVKKLSDRQLGRFTNLRTLSAFRGAEGRIKLAQKILEV
jgi:hypothetical protein